MTKVTTCNYKLCDNKTSLSTNKGVFTWENSHWRKFHTGMTSWLCITFTWASVFSSSHVQRVEADEAIFDWQKLCMLYPFQSTCKPSSHWNEWSFRVYMIPLQNLIPEWNSRPGARTRVNLRRGDSCGHDILWWYYVNKCRAMRGNQSELILAWKLPWCHVNTP